MRDTQPPNVTIARQIDPEPDYQEGLVAMAGRMATRRLPQHTELCAKLFEISFVGHVAFPIRDGSLAGHFQGFGQDFRIE